MPTAYTPLLGLALPVQGELVGTWGDTVNTAITSLTETAIAGATTLSTDADVTLTTTTGLANQARAAVLLCTGARTALRNITAPAASKIYVISNQTTGGYAVVIRGVGPTTGVTVPAGTITQVAWNGTDFVQTNSIGSQTNAATSKATPADADEIPLADSAASFGLKKLTWANLKTAIRTFLSGTSFPIGSTTPSTGAFTTLSATGQVRAKGAVSTNEAGPALGYSGANVSLIGAWGGSGSTRGIQSFYLSDQAGTNGNEYMRLTDTGLAVTGALSATDTSGAITASFTHGVPSIWGTKVIASGSTELQFSGNIAANAGPSIRGVTSGGAGYAPLTLDATTISLKTSGTLAATLSADGNLGLGVAPDAGWSSTKAFQVGPFGAVSGDTATSGEIAVSYNSYAQGVATWRYRAGSGVASRYAQDSSGAHKWYTAPSGTAGNLITFTQAMTLEADGDLLVGTTSGAVAARFVANQPTAANAAIGVWNAATSSDNLFQTFNTEAGGTQRGSIDFNRAGVLTRYNTTSDYRAKDVYGPVLDSGAQLDALKVYRGKMKGATQERPMLIAHEAQEVAPYAVSGTKDEVNADGTPRFQQIDTSSLVPLLIAEIQSLRTRVAQLEGI